MPVMVAGSFFFLCLVLVPIPIVHFSDGSISIASSAQYPYIHIDSILLACAVMKRRSYGRFCVKDNKSEKIYDFVRLNVDQFLVD